MSKTNVLIVCDFVLYMYILYWSVCSPVILRIRPIRCCRCRLSPLRPLVHVSLLGPVMFCDPGDVLTGSTVARE